MAQWNNFCPWIKAQGHDLCPELSRSCQIFQGHDFRDTNQISSLTVSINVFLNVLPKFRGQDCRDTISGTQHDPVPKSSKFCLNVWTLFFAAKGHDVPLRDTIKDTKIIVILKSGNTLTG